MMVRSWKVAHIHDLSTYQVPCLSPAAQPSPCKMRHALASRIHSPVTTFSAPLPGSFPDSQVLEDVCVGPVSVGTSKFMLQADDHAPRAIPPHEISSDHIVMISCSYRGKEFTRISYEVIMRPNSVTCRRIMYVPSRTDRLRHSHAWRKQLTWRKRLTRFPREQVSTRSPPHPVLMRPLLQARNSADCDISNRLDISHGGPSSDERGRRRRRRRRRR